MILLSLSASACTTAFVNPSLNDENKVRAWLVMAVIVGRVHALRASAGLRASAR